MTAAIELGDESVPVTFKDIKNVHLSVHPPAGRVTISAPLRMNLDTVRIFAISKLDWIRRQQRKIRGQDREPVREYLDRESHYVWGKRYLLSLVEHDAPPAVVLKRNKLVLHVRPGTSTAKQSSILDAWYRNQLRAAVPPVLAHYEPLMNVSASRVFIQRMKTRWGSCSPRAGNIRLNTDLAKKPRE
ncbi:MAG TPA: SprT family zinc-dependent metalloprotease, partial [Pirellulales bacterium]